MARLEHVALWVADLEGACEFYARMFGAVVGPHYENAGRGFASRFLRFEDGARLEVMTDATAAAHARVPRMKRSGFAHIALSLGSEQAVDRLTLRAREQGVPVLDGPRRTGDGYYESVILDPEGNHIELTV